MADATVRKFQFQHEEDGTLSLESAVYQALGRASTCWDHIEKAGVFRSEEAKEVGEALLEKIHDDLGPPGHRMGMATTKELLEELRCRMQFEEGPMQFEEASKSAMFTYAACGIALEQLDKDVLSYRTVDSS